jgi:hypothetical protein
MNCSDCPVTKERCEGGAQCPTEHKFQVNVFFKDDGGKEPTEFYPVASSRVEAESKVRSDCKQMGWTDIHHIEVVE